MEASQTNCQRKEKRRRRERIVRIGKEFVAATIKYTIITIFAILVSLGGTTLYDITVGDQVPEVANLGLYAPEKNIIHNSPHTHLLNNWDEEKCWEALQEPLQILDHVCPEVSHWVRDRYKNGHLIWEKEYSGCYAKFHYIDRDLTINRILFAENNGVIASILAHEFRHSRQNFSKYFRATVACSILREPRPCIVEDEAELFEAKVLLAIFG